MVDFALTDEQEALQKLAHDFAQNEIRPYIKEIDRNPDPNKSFPWEIIQKGLELGFGCVFIPEEYGGWGKGLMDNVLITEELAWGDTGVAEGIMTTSDMGRVLTLACSERQKEKWLRQICRDKILLAGSFTEPTGGTEILYPLQDPAMGVRTTAVRDGNDYIINGSKCFVSNAGVATLYVVLARTDKTGPNAESCSLFLVPADTPGLRVGRMEDKMGLRGSSTGTVLFNESCVPAENMLGKEGQAFKVVEETFRGGGVTVGAATVGLARAAYETALKYAGERKSWGQSIRQYELIASKLAEMRMKIEAARALVWKICWAIEHPELSRGLYRLAAMAKVFPSSLIREITADALQILGGYGYLKDYEVEKYVRDAMVFPIFGTTNEMLEMFLASEL